MELLAGLGLRETEAHQAVGSWAKGLAQLRDGGSQLGASGRGWQVLEEGQEICMSWVPEVHHTSGETVPEKRSPGTASLRLGNAVHRK